MSWRFSLLLLLVAGVCWAQFDDTKQNKPASAPQAAPEDPFGVAPSPADPFDAGGQDPFGGGGVDPFAVGPAADDDPFGATSPHPFKKRSVKKRVPGKPGPAPGKILAALTADASQPFERAYPSLTLESEMQRAARSRIDRELSNVTQFEYLEETLADVLDDISYRHELAVVVDTNALEDYGIGTDTPITISIKNVSLRSALTLMLKQLDLTYMIADEVLHITTPDAAEERLVTRFYQISELLPVKTEPCPDGTTPSKGEVITNLIMTLVETDSWDEVGGPGAIQFVEHLDTLAISQTEDVLFKVDNLLATLQEIVDARGGRQ